MGELTHLNKSAGTAKDNIPGIQSVIFAARIDKFTAFGAFVTPIVDPKDALRIDGDHTFGVSDGFARLEGDYKKNNWEGENSADFGSNNGKWTIKGNYYGTGAEAAAALAEYRNADLILLVKRLSVGAAVVNQFGLEQMPARLVAWKWTSGTPDSGSAGIEFTFEAYQPDLLFYEGVITELA